MEQLAGFPFIRVEFTKTGAIYKPSSISKVIDQVPPRTSDVFIVSHGWNNNTAEAYSLYEELFTSIRQELQTAGSNRTHAVIGLFWPSKKFAEEDLIPGGGASVGSDHRAKLQRRLERIGDVIGDSRDSDLRRAIEAAKNLADAQSRSAYVEALRAIIRKDVGGPHADDRLEDAADLFFKDPAEDIFDRLSVPPGMVRITQTQPGSGGAAGSVPHLTHTTAPNGQQSLGGMLRSLEERALDIANFTTYYMMKKRAGIVGGKGAAPLIDALQSRYPIIRIHLIGHSFGGRLVTAAATATSGGGRVASMALLQAAYSHNGLGANIDGHQHDGFFRRLVTERKVRGPIIITHTENDKAVGIAYPIAARIARDNSKALGDAHDQYGGMGRNGAQKANASDQFALMPIASGSNYAFATGAIYNLNADRVIRDHSDIRGRAVARAILSAVSVT